ncbi:MAG: isoprenyl transferase [Bacteroidales bacterium]|nr:isoprenyl transferase [Bacteroidales bacterium]
MNGNDLKNKIIKNKLPQHIAIIMDGNGRWAEKHKLTRVFGHRKGIEAVKTSVECCLELGIPYLSIFAFSTENWKRPKDEINTLFQILSENIDKELPNFLENKIKLLVIGDFSGLPLNLIEKINNAIEVTKNNDKLILCIALSYSGRLDILQMTKKIALLVKNNQISIDDINYDLIKNNLFTSDLPDPDLLIRTSGEFRISNFFLYQIAYTELYVTKTLWPDFDKTEFYKAIIDYQNRERRFGLISQQLRNEK